VTPESAARARAPSDSESGPSRARGGWVRTGGPAWAQRLPALKRGLPQAGPASHLDWPGYGPAAAYRDFKFKLNLLPSSYGVTVPAVRAGPGHCGRTGTVHWQVPSQVLSDILRVQYYTWTA
jgi:hypothetical protein